MVGFCRGDSSLSVLIERLRKELARWLQDDFSGSDYPFPHFFLNSVRSLFFYMLDQDAPAVPSLEKSVLKSCVSSTQCSVKQPSIVFFFIFFVLDPCTLFCHSKLPKWSLRKPISGDRSTRIMTSQKAKKLALCCVIFFLVFLAMWLSV